MIKTPILIFGGSFDPPHLAHLEIARRTMLHIGAKATAFIPCGKAPHKNTTRTSADDRFEMVNLATRKELSFFVLEDEIERVKKDGRPSYTVDTIVSLAKNNPHWSMRLLMGTDQMLSFHEWEGADKIIELAEPVVVVRSPHNKIDILSRMKHPENWEARLLELDTMNLSSTLVRTSVERGEDISGMVTPEVAEFIRKKGLYTKGTLC